MEKEIFNKGVLNSDAYPHKFDPFISSFPLVFTRCPEFIKRLNITEYNRKKGE